MSLMHVSIGTLQASDLLKGRQSLHIISLEDEGQVSHSGRGIETPPHSRP